VSTAPIRIALLGCGTVGSAVLDALREPASAGALQAAAGAPLEVVGIAVAHPERVREGVPPELVVGDAAALVARAHPDVVVEVIGGDTLGIVTAALDAGASVVTANKAMLASHLSTLAAHAEAQGVDLFYEAAVCGAIPVVRVLRDSLAGQRLTRVLGIVNGTTNYVLTTMAREHRDYGDVLAEATELGFAEADPSADVDGHDAAQKAALLATLAFRRPVLDADVPREGISKITAADLDAASRMGYVVRLLAVAERVGDDAISVRVRPAMVPSAHPLAAIDGAANAVFIEGPGPGAITLEGAGAGGHATASAVLGDLVRAARNRVASTADRAPAHHDAIRLLAPGEVSSAFYLALEVADRPGVLAAVATVFGAHEVSIRTMEQTGRSDDARLTFLTHPASEAAMASTMASLGSLDVVTAIGALLRVVEDTAV
jgi:homoserine dehydrogenase